MNRFKEIRQKHDMSQKDMANIFFVNQTAVSQWERGVTTPNAETLKKIADYFDVSVDYLLGRDAQDPDIASLVQEAKERPEIRALFSLAKNASKEDVEQTIDIIKVIRKSNTEFDHNE